MEELRLTLLQHLEELRKRIIISFCAIVLGAIVSYQFIEQIIDLLRKPASQLAFIYLSPPELFVTYMKIAIAAGFVLAVPIILLQIWLFVKPGLLKKERKSLLTALFMAIVFFALGVVFAYFIIIPMTIQFFVKMSTEHIAPLFSFESYISFISSILLSFGLVFEMPLLILLLTHLGFVTPEVLKKSRKIMILVIFIVAAIMTPPDVVSQCLMAVPMVLLYELSLSVSTVIHRKKLKETA